MLWVSTIRVLGFFGSTFPKAFRAIPGLKSLVSFESMVNCFTFPWGTPSTTLRSGAGLYSGPITKLSYASSGGFSPGCNTLKGGAPGSSNLRTGGCAKAVPVNKHVQISNPANGLDMRYPRKCCGFGIESLDADGLHSSCQDSAPKRRSPCRLQAPGRHAEGDSAFGVDCFGLIDRTGQIRIRNAQ